MNIMEFLARLDSFGYQFIRIHASLLWQSFFVMLAAIMIVFLCRSRQAAARHLIFVSAVYLLPLIPVLTWVISLIGSVQTPLKVIPVYNTIQREVIVKDEKNIATGAEEKSNRSIYGYLKNRENPGSSIQTSFISGLVGESENNVSPAAFPFAFLVVLYGAGTSIFLVIIMYGRFRIKWWLLKSKVVTDEQVIGIFRHAGRLLGLRKEYVLVESRHIDVPLTVGTINPVIVLPDGFEENFSENDLNAVALHELTHIYRNDSLTLTLVSIIRAIMFYNPLIWFASRQISSLSEHACDDSVIEFTGEPLAYAKMLAALAEYLPNRAVQIELAAGMLYTKSFFLRRIMDILSEQRVHIQKLSKMAQAGIVSVLTVSLLFALAFPLGVKAIEDSANEELMLYFFESRMAISQGKSEELEDMLWYKPELLKTRDERGYTLVHYAANNINILKLLIDHGADVNVQDGEGNTPLHLAAQWGESGRPGRPDKKNTYGLIQLFVDHGADINAQNNKKRTPLILAAENNNVEIADILIEFGAAYDIHIASELGNIDRVKTFIESDARLVNSKNHDGKTPLHVIAGKVLRSGARYIMDNDKSNSRLYDIEDSQKEILQLLVDNNAEISSKDENGWMPLHYAVKNGNVVLTEKLLKLGSQVNVKNDEGETPLHLAAWFGHYQLTTILLDNGADVHMQNRWEVTPLAWAEGKNHEKISALLSNHGAQHVEPDNNIRNRWDYYLKNPYSDRAFLAYLLASGQSPTESFADWFISGVYRLKRNSGKPLYVVEIYNGTKNKGFTLGCLYIVNSEGSHQKTIMEERIQSGLLMPHEGSYQAGFKYTYKIQEKIAQGEIIELPDLNNDSYADIPTERWEGANRSTAVYLTNSKSIPCVFRIWPYDCITSIREEHVKGHTYIKRMSESDPSLSVMFQPMKQSFDDNGREISASIDLRKPNHIMATFTWNPDIGTFIGPEEGPDGLWFVASQQ